MNFLLFMLAIFVLNKALRDYKGTKGLFKLLDLNLNPK